MGVDKTLQVFGELGDLAVDGVELAKAFKHGIGVGAILGSLGKLVGLGKAVESLVVDLPGSLPELLDLDAAESAKIGQAAYALVRKVLEAVKA